MACLPASIRAQCPVIVSAGDDIYGCGVPLFTTLDGSISGDYLSFTWSPTTGMTGANTLTPNVSVNQPTRYVLRVRAINTNENLVTNGDFEQGNTGFTSDYIYNPGFQQFPWSTYDVTTVSAYAGCTDHTGGGNLMSLDGSDIPDQLVWCQSVNVTPNTEYVLSAWMTATSGCAPYAQLEFTINGTVVGLAGVSPTACQWTNFTGVWNSGNNTVADICIEDILVTGSCNDFGIDDIGLFPVCILTDTVLVQPIQVIAQANPPTVFIPCEGTPIPLNGNGSSTGPPITYLWETLGGNIVSGETTLQPVVDASGVYTLTVTHDYGSGVCSQTAEVQVVPNPNPLIVFTLQPPPLGCPGAPVVLGATSNQGSVTYSWSTIDGNIVSGASTQNPIVNAVGTYEVTVTNTLTGCTAVAAVSTQLTTNPIQALIAPPQPLGCGGNTITLTGSSNQGGVGYTWSTPNGNIVSGQFSPNAVVNQPGTYQLLVINPVSGCTDTASVVVATAADPPIAMASASGAISCTTPTVSLMATGSSAGPSIAYSWSTPDGVILSGQGDSVAVAGAAGMYVLAVTNTSNNCTTLDTVQVVGDTFPPLIAIVPHSPLTCLADTLLLAATVMPPGSIRTWYTPEGDILISGDSTANPVVAAPGIYTLTALNPENGCSASASDTVLANQQVPLVTLLAEDTLSCQHPVATLSSVGSSPGAYQWVGPGLLSGVNGPEATADAPGLYTLIITDTLNGCRDSASVELLADDNAVVIRMQVPDTLTCVQTSVSLDASGSTSGVYTWYNPAGNAISGASGQTLDVDSPGVYTLQVFSPANGCTAVRTVQVIERAEPPNISIGMPDTLTCLSPEIVLEAQVAAGQGQADPVYLWSAAGGGQIVGGTDAASVVVDKPGQYALTVLDPSNGCTAVAAVDVWSDQAAPVVAILMPDTLTCARNQVIIGLLQPEPGTVYGWTTATGQFISGQTGPTPVVGAPGTYTVTATNPLNGCTAVDSVQVRSEALLPEVGLSLPDTLTCNQPVIALAGAVPAGAPYAYMWSGPGILTGQGTTLVQVNQPGPYALVVSDTTNGCSATRSILVAADQVAPLAVIPLPEVLTCDRTQVLLSVQPTDPGYVYQWTASLGGVLTAGANTSAALAGAPGLYRVTVTNPVNGCADTASAEVVADTLAPQVAMGPPPVISCLATTVFLTIYIAPVGLPTSFSWTTTDGIILQGADSDQPLIGAPGTYRVLVRNQTNGCTAEDLVLVGGSIIPPDVDAGASAALTCSAPLQVLGGVVLPSTALLSWSGPGVVLGGNTSTPTVNQPGTYTLTATDPLNGCTATDTVLVRADTLRPEAVVAQPGPITCMQQVLTLDATGSDAGSGIAVLWTGPGLVTGANTYLPMVDAAGTYIMRITNTLNGCTVSIAVQVTANLSPPVANAGPGGVLHCTQNTVILSGSAVPADVSFNWTASTGGVLLSGAGSATAVAGSEGVYVLQVRRTDNGCIGMDSVVVSRAPEPAMALVVEQPGCRQPTGLVEVQVASGTVPPVAYALGTALPFGVDPVFEGLPPGTYTVVLKDGYGCTVAEVVELLAPPLPILQLPEVYSIALGDEVLLVPEVVAASAVTWQWAPPGGLSCSDCPRPTAAPPQTSVYVVTVTDEQGCTASATTRVSVDRKRRVYVPNIFSPDDDGLNDFFTVYAKAALEVEQLSVYDRWGGLVWEGRNLSVGDDLTGWDGRSRGVPAGPAVYVWVARLRFQDGEVEVFSGDVTLVR